ncbi:MAG: hypothetical protein HKN22_06905, partial [Bacteroidia bacterium]|nr:hypothetical protein [Bacteroidia bacterium]
VFFVSSLFYDIEYSVSVLLFPVLVVNLLIFIFAANIILSVLFVYMRDIRHLWSVVIMMLFWVSGVIFAIDPNEDWRIGLFAYLTPIVGIISNSRAVLIYNEPIDWTLFMYDFGYALFFLAIALYIHKRYSGRVLEIL